MSSASKSSKPKESPGSSCRVSTRSHTRRSTQLDSPATGAEPDDDTSTGGVDASFAGSSPDPTSDRPPCADASCPGSLGPICSVPCAVRDLTECPSPDKQREHHERMQPDIASRISSSPGPSYFPRPRHSRFLDPTRWVETLRSIHGTHFSQSYTPDLELTDPHRLSESERSTRSRSPLSDNCPWDTTPECARQQDLHTPTPDLSHDQSQNLPWKPGCWKIR